MKVGSFGQQAKTLFHAGSLYNVSRPTYPIECFDYCESFCSGSSGLTVLDIGCGSGQACKGWSERPSVTSVIGVDPSESQLASAYQHPKIKYYQGGASDMSMIQESSIDIISVFTAAHWFTEDAEVHREIKRVAKDGAVVFFISYAESFTDNQAIDAICGQFQRDLRWDDRIQLNLDKYENIMFPYKSLAGATQSFETGMKNTLEERLAYFKSWSAVMLHEKVTGVNLVEDLKPALESLWHGELPVRFPLHYRIGRV